MTLFLGLAGLLHLAFDGVFAADAKGWRLVSVSTLTVLGLQREFVF